MNISELNYLLEKLINEMKEYDRTNSTGTIEYNLSLQHKYHDFLVQCGQPLFENSDYLRKSYSLNNIDNILDALEYIGTLLNLKEKRRKIELEGTFLNHARQMLDQAGIAFKNNDFPGVSNKLNTCVELMLKEVLDIPTTIKGINVSKIIEIMISENIGPVKYLEEVKKHVLLDNLVKHQGMTIVEARAGTAISSVENLLKRLPKEPFKLNEDSLNKIWSGVN
jgi:hypothetical protein